MKISDLQVKSFVTQMKEAPMQTAKGGIVGISYARTGCFTDAPGGCDPQSHLKVNCHNY